MTYFSSQGKAIPEHLWRLGLAVRRLIVRYDAMDRWKRHVRGWVKLVKERAEKPNYTGVDVMDLLLSREIDGKYALLAAVHDNYASPERNEELIHPWAAEANFAGPDELAPETLDAIATYVGLMHHVLPEQARRGIERSKADDLLTILRAVDDDIRNAARLLTPDRSICVDESGPAPVEEYESFVRRTDTETGNAGSTPAGKTNEDEGNAQAGSTTTGKKVEETNRYAALDKLEPAHRKAWLSFAYAESKRETRLEDRDAWEWLTENGIDEPDEAELTEYKLPTFGTWARYLRVARNAVGERKYTPRIDKHPGRSIVPADEHEPQKTDDE